MEPLKCQMPTDVPYLYADYCPSPQQFFDPIGPQSVGTDLSKQPLQCAFQSDNKKFYATTNTEQVPDHAAPSPNREEADSTPSHTNNNTDENIYLCPPCLQQPIKDHISTSTPVPTSTPSKLREQHTSRMRKRKQSKQIASKSNTHNTFTHFSKDPNC